MTRNDPLLKIRFDGDATGPGRLPVSHLSRSFWESPSLDKLAETQSVKPLMDVRSLFGTWPGDLDDDFETAINELRHGNTEHGE